MEILENSNVVSVKIKDFCRECNVELLYGNEQDYIKFGSVLVNRPGLLLTGFEEYFGQSRIQLIGNAEYYYLKTLNEDDRAKAAERLFSQRIPCVIYSRGIVPFPIEFELAAKYNIPIMVSHVTTTSLNNIVANYLEEILAPMTTFHGTLMDVNGVGVLISGKSGMGKSEAALELIQRGHRLISDDVVVVKQINNELVGTAPEATQFLMEIRGIGIIDVSQMYGAGAVLLKEDIMLVIELNHTNGEIDFDRLGNKMATESILGIDIPKLSIPVTAGRNLAILIEVAARNYRLKNMGFDVLKKLRQRSNLES